MNNSKCLGLLYPGNVESLLDLAKAALCAVLKLHQENSLLLSTAGLNVDIRCMNLASDMIDGNPTIGSPSVSWVCQYIVPVLKIRVGSLPPKSKFRVTLLRAAR